MLETIKSQLAAETETAEDGSGTEHGPTIESRTDADEPTGNDAVRESDPHGAPEERTLDLDAIFGLLKNRRRRDVLRHLSETTETIRLGELADRIAARECEKDVSQITSQERKRVYVGLYQCHLPKLADAGAIDYNKPRGTMECGPTFDQVTHYLPEEDYAEQNAANRSVLSTLANMAATGRNLL